MRRSFREDLGAKILLFDGATGTSLQALGLPVGETPERWNFEKPEAVVQVHSAFVEAGADVVISNTLGANRFRLNGTEFENKTYELNRRAAELAREAAGDDVFVAGSVGSTGVMLVMGETPPEEIVEAYEEQVRGLVEGGVDVFAVETMTDIEEACLAVKAAKSASTLPVVATMTFEPGKRGIRTVMGNDIKTVVERLQEVGADATGSNCGTGIETMIEIIREMRQYTDLPLLGEPNAGLPELQKGKTVFKESADFMASKLSDLLQAGATMVGGCCGTTAEHIRRFRQAIDELET